MCAPGSDPGGGLQVQAADTHREAQGGDPRAALPVAKESEVVYAPADGVLVELDALAVGVAATGAFAFTAAAMMARWIPPHRAR